MTANEYDVIVIGARCAGLPIAMLLARKGYRVLVVDKATFPSDTVSTHLIHPPGVAALRRWGLLGGVVATGCPPIDTYRFDFGPMVISGSPAIDGEPVAYAPRRTVLDELLLAAAREAGAEVREAFGVEKLLTEGSRVVGIRGHGTDGTPVSERARGARRPGRSRDDCPLWTICPRLCSRNARPPGARPAPDTRQVLSDQMGEHLQARNSAASSDRQDRAC